MKTYIIFGILLVMTSCQIVVTDPNLDPRNQIIGSYQLREYSTTYNSTVTYSIFIYKSGYGNLVYIDNFYGAGLSVSGTLNGNTLTIPWQVQDGYEIEGVARVIGNSLQLSYTVHDAYNYSTDFCSSNAWR